MLFRSSQIRPPNSDLTQIRPPNSDLTQIRPPNSDLTQIRPPNSDPAQIRPPISLSPLPSHPPYTHFRLSVSRTHSSLCALDVTKATSLYMTVHALTIHPAYSRPTCHVPMLQSVHAYCSPVSANTGSDTGAPVSANTGSNTGAPVSANTGSNTGAPVSANTSH